METRLPLLSLDEEKLILGPYDRHVKQVSRRLGVRLSSRGGELRFQGPDDAVQALVPRVEDLLTRMRRGDKLGPLEVETALLGSMDPSAERARSVFGEALPDETQPRRMPTARTEAQRVYLEALQRDDLILATGPAGTGKTYLAVAAALQKVSKAPRELEG